MTRKEELKVSDGVCMQGILEIGKRDMTNPKYDGYFEQAKQAIKEVKP